jgi:hypothetical protein
MMARAMRDVSHWRIRAPKVRALLQQARAVASKNGEADLAKVLDALSLILLTDNGAALRAYAKFADGVWERMPASWPRRVQIRARELRDEVASARAHGIYDGNVDATRPITRFEVAEHLAAALELDARLVYEGMPLRGGRRTDLAGRHKSEAFSEDPTSTVKAAFREAAPPGVDVDNLFAAEKMKRARRKRGKSSKR